MHTPFFITLLVSVSIVLGNGRICRETADYINEKLRSSKVAIARAYVDDADDVPLAYNIRWDKLWSEEVNFNQTLALDMFNEMFLLVEGNRIMTVGIEINSSSTLVPSPVRLREVSFIRHEKLVKFLRSFAWNKTLYLLICYEDDVCAIYTSNADYQLHHRQNIKHKAQSIDASFFTKDNDQLYLVIASNLGSHSVPTVIYSWTGTYMDVIQEIMVAFVVAITTFNTHRGSTIIVFGQRDDHQSNIGSEVYEFINHDDKITGSIQRIQFLPTDKPVSLHHYVHRGCDFLLVVDQVKPASIFWWEGKDFLPWHDVNDIHGSNSLLKHVYVNNDTFFLFVQKNILSFYKITSTFYDLLSITDDKEASRIVDFGVWSGNDAMISLVLITERRKDLYRVEPWQLAINVTRKTEIKMNDEGIDTMTVMECFRELEDRLNKRMPEVERSQEAWKKLYPPRSNVNVPSLSVSEVMLHSSKDCSRVSNVILLSLSNKTMISAAKLGVLVKDLAANVEDLLSASKMIVQRKDNGNSSGILVVPRLVIEGNARFKTLETHSLRTESINGVGIDDELRKTIFSKENQHFSESLKARNVTIHHLIVDSLCGITQKHWLLKNDSLRMPLKPINQPINQSLIEIVNDTVKIHSDASFINVRVETLDSVNLNDFFDDLFILGERQIIKGNVIYQSLVSINNLTLSGKLNGVVKNDLITLTTNQHFTSPVKIDSLEVFDLRVNQINGVSVENAARVSEENVIHGEVILDKLIVTEEFVVDDPRAFVGEERQIQVYEDVRITGNALIDHLSLDQQALLNLNDQKTQGYELDNLLINSWTKSSDQVIPSPVVVFDKGLTIDALNAKHLNDLNEDEYLYTTAKSFPSNLSNVHFVNLIVNSSRNQIKLFDVSEHYVTFNRQVRFKFLAVKSLYTERYNGMPINVVMSNPINNHKPRVLYLPTGTHFCNLIVNDRLIVDNLVYQTKNQGEKTDILFINQDYNLRNLTADDLHAGAFQKSFDIGLSPSRELDITVRGELIIDELNVEEFINDETVNDYMDHLSIEDIHINDDKLLSIDNLTVLHDSTVEYIEDEHFNDLISDIFSKSRDQEAAGTKVFHRVTSSNLQVKKINGIAMDQLYFINDSLIFEDNITFTDLSAHVQTANINGININTILNGQLAFIESTKIKTLRINGSVFWTKNQSHPSSSSSSSSSSSENRLSSLLNNAVTLQDEQTIEAETDFSFKDCNVYSNSVFSVNRLSPDIQAITEDAIVANSNSRIRIAGKKVFQGSITVGDLKVDDNLEIARLETMTINELNESLIRKLNEDKTIEGPCTFVGEGLNISQLVVANLGPGMPDISALFVISDDEKNILPLNTRFTKLTVRGNATVESLDGVTLDKFLRERVTLHGNHEILSNIRFNGPVEVTEEAIVKTSINGIGPGDLLINGSSQEQIIDGQNVFLEDLQVDGHLEVESVNGKNVAEANANGVLSDEPAVIQGDLVIENDVEILSQLIMTGTVNGFNLSQLPQDHNNSKDTNLQIVNKDIKMIEKWTNEATQVLKKNGLPELFYYLESDKSLSITNVQNADKIVSLNVGSLTKLNIYGTQLGRYCLDLPDDCPCRTQYVVEISNNTCRSWRIKNGSSIVYNFHVPSGPVGINIQSNSMSSSPRCSLPANQRDNEYTTVLWMKLDELGNAHVFEDNDMKIKGYLSDVQVFEQNHTAYIVLAMSYDAINETHEANSFIYKLDLKKNELSLELTININSASVVEVFKLPNEASHVLICSSLGESLLYRLDSTTNVFTMIRSFLTGGTKHAKSLGNGSEDFLLMDDIKTNVVLVYKYNVYFDNYYLYQSLHHEAPVSALETFYVGESRQSDAYVVVVTENGDFLLYEYMMFGKFQMKMNKRMHALLTVGPFHLPGHQHLLLVSQDNSTVLRIVQQGLHF